MNLPKRAKLLRCSASALSLLGATVAHLAFAQTVAPPAPTDNGIEDIVVTAQRREERLQDVPVAVTAVTGSALAAKGVNATFDLPVAVPGLLVNRSSYSTILFLRGVGSSSIAPGNEPSVATYVDGVYQPFPNGAQFALNNVQRIEVLKGPQGTLFGRNATAGLIQIVTKDPSVTPTADLKVGYGNYKTVDASAYLSGGFDRVAADIAMIYTHQGDGWGQNLYRPERAGTVLVNGQPVTLRDLKSYDVGVMSQFAIRSKIVIEATDELKVKLTGQYARTSTDQGIYRSFLPGSQALVTSSSFSTPYTREGGFYDTATVVRPTSTNQQLQLTGDLSYDAGPVTLRSISAYTDAEGVLYSQSTWQPRVDNSGQTSEPHLPFKSFTQEFQAASGKTDSLQWLVGAFYINLKSGFDPLDFYRGDKLEATNTRVTHSETNSIAGFAQASYAITSATQLTAGIRYTRDRYQASQYYEGRTATSVPAPSAVNQLGVLSNIVPLQKGRSENVSYRLAVDHHFTSDIMAYASFNTGYKSGNLNVGVLCTVTVIGNCPIQSYAPEIKPEILKSYEIGLKSDLFDRHLRVNLAGFYYDYSNLQVQVLGCNGLCSAIQNAASARVWGFDAELEGRVSRAFSLNANFELLNAKFRQFPGAIGFVPRTVAPYGDAQVVVDAGGNSMPRAPRFSGSFGGTYVADISAGTVTANLSYYYNSGFYWDFTERLRQNSYGLLNGDITLQTRGPWSLRVWGRNLTSSKYYSFVDSSTIGDRGSPAAPLTFGATIGWKM